MNISLKPSAYSAALVIPSSKSYMQRAVALAILAESETTLENPDCSSDSLAGIGIARALGCPVYNQDGSLRIGRMKGPLPASVSVGEAGLGLRLYTPVCALLGSGITIEGRGTLLSRPMDSLREPMRQLGAEVELSNGRYAPIHIKSALKGGRAVIDGSESSQFLTGLLVALPLAGRDSVIEVSSLKSLPYVQMTLDIIKKFGGQICNEDFKVFRIKGRQKYTGTRYAVEGDWSSAAAHLVAGATSGKAVVKGLNPGSLQADKAVLDVLRACGAGVEVVSDCVSVTKARLSAFDFDATNCPDLFPVLASLAASCEGHSRIKGVSRLAHKESDRASAIRDEFAKIGISVTLDGDLMTIAGGKIRGAKVSSHKDHRMAMCMAVCALSADGEIEIDNAECVGKSYPRFWEDYETSAVRG